MKAILGQRPAPPPKKDHDWESSWLNQPLGEKHCKRCGCTLWEVTSASHLYEDCEGRRYSSKEPLGCPTYFGVTFGTSVKLQEELRKAPVERAYVDQQFQQLEQLVQQLQAENNDLRQALQDGPQVNMGELAQAMLDLLESRRRESEAEPAALPEAKNLR